MRLLGVAAVVLFIAGWVGAQDTPTAAVRVPASVMGKQVQSYVQPVYPESAKRAQIEGTVTLGAVIDAKGKVQSLTVVSGPEALRQGTLDAVKKWVYEPYLLNGEPVAVETSIVVNFSLGPRRIADVPAANGTGIDEKPAAEIGPCGEPVGQPTSGAGRGSTRIPGSVMAGMLLTHPNPVYPKDAKLKHITGTVVVHAIIGKDGKIADASVLCGPAELQASSLAAIRQWTYVPYLLSGRLVAVDTTVSVTYDMGLGVADRVKQRLKDSGQPEELRSDDKEVRKAKKVKPVYPAEAKQQGIGGDVTVSVVVGLDGHVEAVHAIDGPVVLRDAALDSVRQWTFKPYAVYGQAEKFHTVVTVNFKAK